MGFADQARKILEYNRGLLRKKNFFQNLGKPQRKSNPAKIDSTKLEENAIRMAEKDYKRNLQRRIVIVFIALILLFFAAFLAYYF